MASTLNYSGNVLAHLFGSLRACNIHLNMTSVYLSSFAASLRYFLEACLSNAVKISSNCAGSGVIVGGAGSPPTFLTLKYLNSRVGTHSANSSGSSSSRTSAKVIGAGTFFCDGSFNLLDDLRLEDDCKGDSGYVIGLVHCKYMYGGRRDVPFFTLNKFGADATGLGGVGWMSSGEERGGTAGWGGVGSSLAGFIEGL